MAARVLIGIPSYNDLEYLELLLRSIKLYTDLDEPYDLVVVDDGSRAELIPHLKHLCEAEHNIPFLEHPHNEGIPATWNHLSQAFGAKSEIVVLLNNDMLMVPDWLRVLVYFLDANKDVPSLGTVSLQPRHVLQHNAKKLFRVMVDDLAHTVFRFEELQSGKEAAHEAVLAHDPNVRGKIFDVKEGEGHGVGKVMCPCGCSFAFRRSAFDLVGGFDENIKSFFEESDFGTKLAQLGRASFCLNYPRPYHVRSGTFAINPELEAHPRMLASRAYYRKKWDVPEGAPDFDVVNQRFMSQIPDYEYKFLSPNYALPPIQRSIPGGATIAPPQLEVKTQVVF